MSLHPPEDWGQTGKSTIIMMLNIISYTYSGSSGISRLNGKRAEMEKLLVIMKGQKTYKMGKFLISLEEMSQDFIWTSDKAKQ